MSTRPRIESAIPGRPAEFATVMSHTPEATGRFFDLYAEFWQRGVVGPELKEMTRLRNARVTDCGYWRNVRFDSAREAGLEETKAAQIDDGYEQVFDPRETAALRLTDALIGDPRSLTDEQRVSLQDHFTDAEIVEISLGVGLFLAMSKVLIVLGLEPEEMPTTVIPTPGSWSARKLIRPFPET